MVPSIAVQLYSVREQLAEDFEDVIRRIAAIGYAGVETAGFANTTPEAAAGLFQELGLAVPAAHVPLPLGDKRQEVLETLDALACKRAVCAWQPPEEFKTPNGIQGVAERLNQAAEVFEAQAITLLYHNHWFELEEVEGKYALFHLLDHLNPGIQLEIDTYWARTAGADPVAILQELGERTAIIHIKDGPCRMDEPMVAVGSGEMDIPAVLAAGMPTSKWLVVELDSCATDMLAAVEDSYHYLDALLS